VGGAVARFAVTGFVVLLLVGLGGVEVLHRAGRNEATRDARELSEVAGRGIVRPAITAALLRGDPEAIARMDRVVHRRVRGRSVVRVKLWDAAGRVVYSDEHRLIGAVYRLPQDERDALASGGADAEVSDLGRPENRFERPYGKLMEVYLGIAGPGGKKLLFETYQRYGTVASSGRRLWLALLPVLLGALGLLAVLQVPLAWSLARRLKRSEHDRLRLLERAIDAQVRERRRIAGDLHDGVVQSLAGISFRLGAARECVDERTPGRLVTAVDESMAETRESIRALRSLLVDIHPPSLRREGLVAALSDLISRTGSRRLTGRLETSEADVRLPAETEALLFRAAQEALRNVVAHARASNVTVAVHRVNGHVALSVTDDGEGFDPGGASRSPGSHFGLLAIGDLVQDHGGTLRVDSAPGRGTTLEVEVPVG
jgi:signal transduction histidine kinase